MVNFKTTELELKHVFDRKHCRHYLNGFSSVLHCHHYATLYTQLGEDCEFIDGLNLLSECSEDCFFEILSKYYEDNNIKSYDDRISISEQYFAVSGLGKMKITYAGAESGEVRLEYSHIDEGWIKKWGKRDKPVNYIGCGYIAGMFSAVFNKKVRTYTVHETASIVSGDKASVFNVTLK